MKKILFSMTALMLTVGSLLLTSCKDDKTTQIRNVPAVEKIANNPLPTATAGYTPGTEVTLSGVNLQNVVRITVGGFDATITNKGVKSMVFTVPAGNFPQDVHSDAPLCVYGSYDAEKPVYTTAFFVFVPLTDAFVSEHSPIGKVTIGDKVTIKGRNLDKINSVALGTFAVAKADFKAQSATEIEFAIPAAAYAEGENSLVLKAFWGDDNKELVINSNFTVLTPGTITPPTQGAKPAIIGDELEFTGTYMDLFDEIYVGNVKATIIEQSPTKLKIKVANGEYGAAKAGSKVAARAANVKQVAIVGYYGNPKQTKTLFANFNLDITPPAATAPTFMSVTAEDGGAANDKFYLKKQVTLKGANFSAIESITVDGLTATIQNGRSDGELTFVMPEDFTFMTATKCEFMASYSGGLTVTIPTAETQMVYPFYYWKDVKIAPQDGTVSPFFSPDNGQTYSVDQWYDMSIDSYAKANTLTAVGSSATNPNAATFGSAANYYSVHPYFFMVNNSSDTPIVSPANSSSLGKFKRDGVSLPAVGSPAVFFRPLTETDNGENNKYADSVKNGTIKCLNLYTGTRGGSGAPKYNTNISTSSYHGDNCVITVQYSAYGIGKSASMEQVKKTGFLLIKSITGMTGNKGSDQTVMTFDCYWPKNTNPTAIN